MNKDRATAGMSPWFAQRWSAIESTYKGMLIFLAALVIFLVFSQRMAITDPVEANYALTAKEMVLSGDWLAPRIYGKVWFDKPAMFYWLEAASFKVFGFSEFAARMVPAIFSAFGVAMIYWFTLQISTHRRAMLAAVLLGTSLQFLVLSKLIITDTVLFLFSNAGLVFFYLGYIRSRDTDRWYLLMYPCLALAVLTKGPVGLLLPALIIILFLAIEGKVSEFHNMHLPVGLLLFSVIACPWYLRMYQKYGSEFVRTFFGVHNYLRATVSEHPKDDVFYYYAVVFLVSLLPWSGLALRSVYEGYKRVRATACRETLFYLVWAGAYFIFYSFMATKYLTYTFPLLFPVAILTADYLDRCFGQGGTRRLGWWLGIPQTILLTGLMILTYQYVKGTGALVTAAGLGLVLLAGWWHWYKGDAQKMFYAVAGGSVAAFVLMSAVVLPVGMNLRSGKALGEELNTLGNAPLAMYEDYSTSAVFYSGKLAVRLEDTDILAKDQPGALSWSSKYTMPMETTAGFFDRLGRQTAIVVVPKAKRQQFERNFQGTRVEWIGEVRDMYLARAAL